MFFSASNISSLSGNSREGAGIYFSRLTVCTCCVCVSIRYLFLRLLLSPLPPALPPKADSFPCESLRLFFGKEFNNIIYFSLKHNSPICKLRETAYFNFCWRNMWLANLLICTLVLVVAFGVCPVSYNTCILHLWKKTFPPFGTGLSNPPQSKSEEASHHSQEKDTGGGL